MSPVSLKACRLNLHISGLPPQSPERRPSRSRYPKTALGSRRIWIGSEGIYQTLPYGVEVLLHLPQEQLQLAPCHVELLLGFITRLQTVFRLELRPQRLQGVLLGLPDPQLLLQLLTGKTDKRRKQLNAELIHVSVNDDCGLLLFGSFIKTVKDNDKNTKKDSETAQPYLGFQFGETSIVS